MYLSYETILQINKLNFIMINDCGRESVHKLEYALSVSIQINLV